MSSASRLFCFCRRHSIVHSSPCSTVAPARNYSQRAHQPGPDHSASSKLFEDAAREEEESERARRPSVVSTQETKDRNWDGDEPIEHAVLRMLVDKYKPLRVGPIRTAEEKLKQAPPQVRTREASPASGQESATTVPTATHEEPVPRRYTPGEPILPGIPGHQPWHTTFTVPSHATSSVKYGNIPPPKPNVAPSGLSITPLDDKARRKQREALKRMEQGTRLSRARESTLDYRLGIKSGATDQYRRPNPVSLKGWASLVEDRIEKARLAGQFNNIKGRGQPIAKTAEDRNPFIGREELLMNRIVQRQGAAPPWVEIQGELESAVDTFREVLKQSWTRRALRTLTAMHPASLLPKVTLADVAALRDPEWVEKERCYHETALEEVNSLVRKYNGVVPYSVRRAYYMRSAELERMYKAAGEDILRGLEERARASSGGGSRRSAFGGDEEDKPSGEGDGGTSRGLWATVREMVATIWGR